MIEINGKRVVFESYPNGESRLVESTFAPYLSQPQVLMRYENDQDLVHLKFLRHWLHERHSALLPNLHLTHMPYARMDRAAPGQSFFTLRVVTDFINALNFGRLTVADPHSDMCMGLLLRAREVSVMDELVARARASVVESSACDPFLVFPDAGAQKKYERFDTSHDALLGFKHRNFSDGTIDSLDVIDPLSSRVFVHPTTWTKTALIVDDLCSYGGTFVRTSEVLRSKFGFEKVYLAVAHCEDSVWDGDLEKHVDHVYTTNSMSDRRQQESAWLTRYPQAELLKGNQ